MTEGRCTLYICHTQWEWEIYKTLSTTQTINKVVISQASHQLQTRHFWNESAICLPGIAFNKLLRTESDVAK